MYCYILNDHKLSALKRHPWVSGFGRSTVQAAQWVLCFLPHGATAQVSVGLGPPLETGGGSASKLIQVVSTMVKVALSTLLSCWCWSGTTVSTQRRSHVLDCGPSISAVEHPLYIESLSGSYLPHFLLCYCLRQPSVSAGLLALSEAHLVNLP
ncbi:hypothetical protein HJG60_011115 [Phyllostomus discolor]|uniref:Uncharacterized protein n=1 Tax=Phyllostomus discolor TaxID=89673 RepID=A0A834E503_9CHIR|nr:hypothetical protein HJG60_011115 [Phyllostomus discolor]